jgi:hypothetical protein
VDEERFVECARHGRCGPAFVCQHLVAGKDGPPLGFHAAEIDPYNRTWGDLNGWCDECDQVYVLEGGWTDVAEEFASIKLVCADCFDELEAKHASEEAAG